MIYSSRLISSEQIQKVDFEIFDFRALLLLKIICLCLITTRNTSGGNFRSRMHNIIVLLYRREQNRSTAFCRMREVKIALSLTKNIGQTLSSCKDWQFLPARGDNSDQIVAWLIYDFFWQISDYFFNHFKYSTISHFDFLALVTWAWFHFRRCSAVAEHDDMAPLENDNLSNHL